MHSFRNDLRATTATAHATLDARVSALDLAERGDYAAFLTMHAAVLPALEREAARVCAGVAGLALDRRVRTPALTADLAALGLDVPAPLPARALDGPEEGLGLLYVLEGSRLGAQVLIRRVTQSEDAGVRGATRYLAHGHSQKLFASFLDAASPYLQDGTALLRARSGALMGFDAFDRACRRHVPPQAEDGRARV